MSDINSFDGSQEQYDSLSARIGKYNDLFADLQDASGEYNDLVAVINGTEDSPGLADKLTNAATQRDDYLSQVEELSPQFEDLVTTTGSKIAQDLADESARLFDEATIDTGELADLAKEYNIDPKLLQSEYQQIASEEGGADTIGGTKP